MKIAFCRVYITVLIKGKKYSAPFILRFNHIQFFFIRSSCFIHVYKSNSAKSCIRIKIFFYLIGSVLYGKLCKIISDTAVVCSGEFAFLICHTYCDRIYYRLHWKTIIYFWKLEFLFPCFIVYYSVLVYAVMTAYINSVYDSFYTYIIRKPGFKAHFTFFCSESAGDKTAPYSLRCCLYCFTGTPQNVRTSLFIIHIRVGYSLAVFLYYLIKNDLAFFVGYIHPISFTAYVLKKQLYKLMSIRSGVCCWKLPFVTLTRTKTVFHKITERTACIHIKSCRAVHYKTSVKTLCRLRTYIYFSVLEIVFRSRNIEYSSTPFIVFFKPFTHIFPKRVLLIIYKHLVQCSGRRWNIHSS